LKNSKSYIILGFVVVGLIAYFCENKHVNTYYVGNFQEQQFDFLESFKHNADKDYYYKLPFDLKFGGIRPYPFDSMGKKDYSWLRNPKNLIIAFNTIKSIGLDKFVSIEQYNIVDSEWCCNTLWNKKSLNEIVSGFIKSDTNSIKKDYYSKFWQRRRIEGNLKETYQIFKQINDFYNVKRNEKRAERIDTVLIKLLDFDIQLMHSDSGSYSKIAVAYFKYLKSVKLDYSAYKLIFHNPKVNLPQHIKDSLLKTIKHDTLNFEQWNKLNDNYKGWITSDVYIDPNRYYGP
jgi:hypothetical protein